ncbi:MAG: peptidoglycan-binding domain-containing protein, partial [Myxococcota bacterium]
QGLAIDGAVGPMTQGKLASTRPLTGAARELAELPANTLLARGSAGEGVRRLQTALNERGAKLSVDGRYGPATESAVVAFQKQAGLAPDGVAGRQTLGALSRAEGAGEAAVPAGRNRTAERAADSRRVHAQQGHPQAPRASTPAQRTTPTVTPGAGTSGPAKHDATTGTHVDRVRTVEELSAPKGSTKGSAPMAVFDNPETISTTGLIGNTIANRMEGRPGNPQYDFPGHGRLYSLVLNQTQRDATRKKSGVNSVVAYNPSDKPLTLTMEGVHFSKKVSKTDGTISDLYVRNSGFRGPQAIAASSYMEKKEGENGFLRKTVTIPPRSAAVISSLPQLPGGEVFTMLDMKADGKFRLAQAVTDKPLTKTDLGRIVDGSFPSAGVAHRNGDGHGDFAPAGANQLGRPNGVVPGSIFHGGTPVDVVPGRTHGELLMATRFKKAEGHTDLQGLTASPGNKGGVGDAAAHNDAGYGMTYRMDYPLRNRSSQPRQVEVVLTSPALKTDEPFSPDGGMLNVAVKMNGVHNNLRVSARGDGVVIGTVEVPPNSTKKLSLEFSNLGMTYAPAGIELRTLGGENQATQRNHVGELIQGVWHRVTGGR